MRIYLTLTLLFALISCGGNKPKGIIPEKDFTDVIVDIHLADALATDHNLNDVTGNLDSLALYSSVFAKHNIDRETFDKSMRWYAKKPETLEKIYEDAFAKINKVSQNWEDELNLFSSDGNKVIYKTKKYVDTRGDSVLYPKPVFIDIDSVGTFLFDIKIRMLDDDESENPKIRAVFYDHKDTPSDSLVAFDFPIYKSNFSRDYQYIVPVENKDFTVLKIQVPLVDNKSEVFRKNFQLSSLTVKMSTEKKEGK